MNQSLILMGINSELTVLSFCCICLFFYYMSKNKEEGYDFLRPAIALMVLWVGTFVLRAPIWYSRQMVSLGYHTLPGNFELMFGGIILTLGHLCVIRVFSPASWGHKSWIYAFLIASTVTLISQLVTYYWGVS